MSEGGNIQLGDYSISPESIDVMGLVKDFIESHEELIEDVAEAAEGSIKLFKAASSISSFIKRRKLKAFLKLYAKTFSEQHKETKKEVLASQLHSYMTKSKNAEFISNCIDGAINNNSVYCSSILGFMTGRTLACLKEVDYLDLIFMRALKDLTDTELASFIRIYEGIDNYQSNCHHVYLIVDKHHQPCCEYMVQKCKSLLLLRDHIPVTLTKSEQTAWEKFFIDDVGELFYDLVKNSGVFEQLIKEYEIEVRN